MHYKLVSKKNSVYQRKSFCIEIIQSSEAGSVAIRIIDHFIRCIQYSQRLAVVKYLSISKLLRKNTSKLPDKINLSYNISIILQLLYQ